MKISIKAHFLRKKGYTIREIQKLLKISSPSLVKFYLDKFTKRPICPVCRKNSIAMYNMTSDNSRGLYCTNGDCEYEKKEEELTTPIN